MYWPHFAFKMRARNTKSFICFFTKRTFEKNVCRKGHRKHRIEANKLRAFTCLYFSYKGEMIDDINQIGLYTFNLCKMCKPHIFRVYGLYKQLINIIAILFHFLMFGAVVLACVQAQCIFKRLSAMLLNNNIFVNIPALLCYIIIYV